MMAGYCIGVFDGLLSVGADVTAGRSRLHGYSCADDSGCCSLVPVSNTSVSLLTGAELQQSV